MRDRIFVGLDIHDRLPARWPQPLPTETRTHRESPQLGETISGVTRPVYRGLERVRSRVSLVLTANNLARRPRLLAARNRPGIGEPLNIFDIEIFVDC
jgi:hypothetical protein